jgi:prolyl-tRNA synthetase
MSAAIEQKNDKDGIVWPASLAPYHVVVAPVRADDETLMAAADKIYNQLSALGIEVLLDDRLGSVGVRLKDVDLMGITYKVIVGRSLAEGKVELKERATGKMDLVAVDAVAAEIKTRLKNVL